MFRERRIKKAVISNCFVRSATNEHLGTHEGIITNAYLNEYESLAKNEVGLIITSHMAVDNEQRVDETQICITKEKNHTLLSRLSDIVHSRGSKIIVQLSQGGHKASNLVHQQALSVCGGTNIFPMTKYDIEKCIDNFVKAALIAKQTGFDGIQLHLAHGYLLCEFLDPFFNKRDDSYGGTVENRYRIIHQIVTKCRKECGNDFILSVKINMSSYENNSNFFDEQLKVCQWLEQDGIDLIEVSGVEFAQQEKELPYFLLEASTLKKVVEVPIVLTGGFRNIGQIDKALGNGIDFIAASRPFICENDFIKKLKEGKSSRCTDCNCCYEIYREEFKRCFLHTDINEQLKNNFSNK